MKYLKLLVFLASLLVTACNPVALQLDSGPMRVPVTNAGYHWVADRFPIPVYIHPNMDPSRMIGVYLAAEQWNSLVGSQVFITIVAPADWPMFEENGAINRFGYISVEEGPMGRDPASGAQINALAAVTLKGGEYELVGEIHSARIMMGTHLSNMDEIVPIAFHEFGHCLGLAHDSNDIMSIMYYSATVSSSQRLQPEDLAYVKGQVEGWVDLEDFHESLTKQRVVAFTF